MEAAAGERLKHVLESYHRLTGTELAADPDDLWHAPIAVLAHNCEDPPTFIYANATALSLFGYTAAKLIGMPSHRSAEPEERKERAAMLAQLEAEDIVTGYSGIRVAGNGTRFRIVDAEIWNVRDRSGTLHGQAARIEDFDFLD